MRLVSAKPPPPCASLAPNSPPPCASLAPTPPPPPVRLVSANPPPPPPVRLVKRGARSRSNNVAVPDTQTHWYVMTTFTAGNTLQAHVACSYNVAKWAVAVGREGSTDFSSREYFFFLIPRNWTVLVLCVCMSNMLHCACRSECGSPGMWASCVYMYRFMCRCMA